MKENVRLCLCCGKKFPCKKMEEKEPSKWEFIHCYQCVFTKMGLKRCEECNTQYLCRSQHGEDCNCYLWG